MGTVRSSHVNCLRANASTIFGPGFEQSWFPSKFKRGTIEKLQQLLGAQVSTQGKKYILLPPILFPSGSKSKRDIFMNPALVKACITFHQTFTTLHTDRAQVLKVILFGPSSIAETPGNTGPKPAGVKWGLGEVTPGTIALAAILVSTPSLNDSIYSR
jgi:hypothetical protein